MRYILFLTTTLLSASAFAQTTIDITSQAPAVTVCSYPTDHVATGATPGHLATRLTGSPSGTGCVIGGGNPGVSFGPASPLAPNISSLSGGTASAPDVAASFTAQPVNAVSCSAAIATTVGLGTGTLTGGASVCNSAATCSSALSIPATFSNPSTSATSTYVVTITCNGAVGASPPATASSVTVTQQQRGVIIPPPGACPTVIPSSTTGITNFTQLTGTPSVFYFSAGSFNTDVTSMDAIFRGPWPGNASLTAVIDLPTNKYVSAKFHVPAGFLAGFPTGVFGDYTMNNSNFTATVSMTISTTCGDFAYPVTAPTSSVVPGCWRNKQPVGGLLQWRKDTTCVLQDNHDYYFNFINADVSAIQALNGSTAGGTASSTKNANCGSSCSDPIANSPNSW
jgi:hypothetical protein